MENENHLREEISELLKSTEPSELRHIVLRMQTLMTCYRCAIREIETKFRVLDEQLSLKRKRSPIEAIKTRLKTLPSIREKLQRTGKPLTPESIEENLCDVAGIRVICGYIDDVYMLADCLLRQDDVTLIEKKDYIKNPKPNGYRSLHLIVEIPIFFSDEKRLVKAEVQLRTIAMETWANLEHGICYKKELAEETLARISARLAECAKMSNDLDVMMQDIRDTVDAADNESDPTN